MMIGRPGKLGEIRQGYLADLLLVKGDPSKDAEMMTDQTNIALIMKDGQIYKSTLKAGQGSLAAE